MTQLTVRGIDAKLHQYLKQEAERRGESVNRYVLSLLRNAAGDESNTQKTLRHHDLDHLAGTWSEDEFEAFDRQLAAQRTIDEEIWR
ncbi:antitoxin [bacterium]|nr:antitoxin [bacterium]